MVSAINELLFDRHGFGRMRAHGDPADSNLRAVLERGAGTPATLTVVYCEVAERCGIPLHAASLDGGRYFVLWPADPGTRLAAGGMKFVIDPYAKGQLLNEKEVLELFEVDGGLEEGLHPTGPSGILATVLAQLRDAHWCRAVGCPPEPAFAVPISPAVALGSWDEVEVASSSNSTSRDKDVDTREEESSIGGRGARRWWPSMGYSLSRALAAASKRARALPGDPDSALHHGLLLFFAGRQVEAVAVLQAKLRMMEHLKLRT
jgi:hypothetical protein